MNKKKLIRLTESEFNDIIKESVNKILTEALNNNVDSNKLIKEVLLNGQFVNLNNKEGYEIGVGYGGGTKKEFFYPYSESMEHSYCHVTVKDIINVIEELKNEGYEFERDDEYVFMKGERKPFKPFIPYNNKRKEIKQNNDKTNYLNPNRNPIEYYSDKIFTNSKDGNLHLF